MMSVERERFTAVVAEALSGYVKTASEKDVDAWWGKLRGFALHDIEHAFKAHEADPEHGDRAPRPVDIARRLMAGSRSGSGCAARGANGACQYPGIFSDDTHGGGSCWCPWHRVDQYGPEAERWILISAEVPYDVAMAKRAERFHADAIRSPSVVATAHAIALRHGDRPWAGKRFSAPFNEDAEDAA